MLRFPMRRAFSTTARVWEQYYARTTLHPTNYKLSQPSPAYNSVLVLATPSNLPQVIEQSINLYQNSNIQVLVAGVDTVVPNSARNGISELWLDEHVTITQPVQVDERDDIGTLPKESDGIHVVSARKNWKSIESSLKLHFNPTTYLDIKLANTVFTIGNLVTMYYLQPGATEDSNNGHTLCDITVEFPSWLVKSSRKVQTTDNWTPLYDYATEPELIVTQCTGNLVKMVNDKSASGYLEHNDRLMNIASKETQVYVKLYRGNQVRKYEVIAGGGGWGAKANILALSPDADVAKGDRIEFYMLTPTDRRQMKRTVDNISSNQLVFETSYEQQSYASEDTEAKNSESLEIFGCGSEEGFLFNGVQHTSAGERVSITTA